MYNNTIFKQGLLVSKKKKAAKVKIIPTRFLCKCTVLLKAAVFELS